MVLFKDKAKENSESLNTPSYEYIIVKTLLQFWNKINFQIRKNILKDKNVKQFLIHLFKVCHFSSYSVHFSKQSP